MLITITLMTFSLMMLISYLIFRKVFGNRLHINARLKKVYQGEQDFISQREEDLQNRSFLKLFATLTNRLTSLTSKNKIKKVTSQLEKAGMNEKYNASGWIFFRNVTSLGIGILVGALTFTLDGNIVKALFFSVTLLVVVRFILRFQILGKIESKKKNILKALPFTLDLITVSVEAGLSFDGALTRVILSVDSELSKEFTKTLKEMRMGIERKKALKNLSSRCDVRELSSLVTSLVQADELGVSLGKVLRIQADHLRESRKQKAREKAMKVPVKMLIPLIFFIFPAIFVIILGPALIRLFSIFQG